MKEIKGYTPGPWIKSEPKKNEQYGNQTYFTIQAKNPLLLPGTFKQPGFYYPHSVQTLDEMEANATLIAAAPSLYEENIKLQEELDALHSNMQYYMEYCQANGYVTPMEWIEKHKHF